MVLYRSYHIRWFPVLQLSCQMARLYRCSCHARWFPVLQCPAGWFYYCSCHTECLVSSAAVVTLDGSTTVPQLSHQLLPSTAVVTALGSTVVQQLSHQKIPSAEVVTRDHSSTAAVTQDCTQYCSCSTRCFCCSIAAVISDGSQWCFCHCSCHTRLFPVLQLSCEIVLVLQLSQQMVSGNAVVPPDSSSNAASISEGCQWCFRHTRWF
jgi:hypothetical protein